MKSARLRLLLLLLGPVALLPVACGPHPAAEASAPEQRTTPGTPVFTNYLPLITNRFPHDSRAFTQGLLFLDAETLLESTGLHGQSSLRKVDLKTGKVLRKIDLPRQYFAEGLTLLNGKIFQLTWKAHKGFIYDAATLEQTGTFPYAGEGWGLTTDGTSLILSDGTNRLRFLHPETFAVTRTIEVTHEGKPVDHLNELEFVEGEIFANLWGADLIARIDPATGRSTGVINCTGIFPAAARSTPEQVLNGIAWHAPTKRLLITGKWWPEIFEITLAPSG